MVDHEKRPHGRHCTGPPYRQTVDQREDGLPHTLRGAVALLFLHALSLTVLVGFLLLTMLRADPAMVLSRVILPFEILAVVLAAVLAALGWQLLRRRAWARGPVLALELLLVPFGYYLIQLGSTWLGLAVIGTAVGCVALLIAPASRTALGITR
jgi:hypothetical protein